jgi:hypothetical protein
MTHSGDDIFTSENPDRQATPIIANPEPVKESRLLNPLERVFEIMFGLIMALSFTCAVSVVQAHRPEVKYMLLAAIGCNIAWGVIDAVFYTLNGLVEQGRNVTLVHFVRDTADTEKAKDFIADSFPPLIGRIILREHLEYIRRGLLHLSPSVIRVRLTRKDFKMAFAIFLLVFLSTFPVTIPFIFIQNVRLALRISNLIAIILLFIGGWMLGRYGGFNKIRTALAIALIGIMMVFLTIQLGG